MGNVLLVVFVVFCASGFVAGVLLSKLVLREAHSLEMRANEAFAAMSADIADLQHGLEVLEQRANGAIKVVQGHGTA